jgi:hypothetical protein
LRARNLFGPAHRYLSSEIQKAEIIAMMITRRPILRRVAFVMVLVMWVMALAALVWLYGTGRDNPTPTDLVVMIVLTVVPMVTALHLALQQVMRPLRPGSTALQAGRREAGSASLYSAPLLLVRLSQPLPYDRSGGPPS